jgi:hypothetical protein
LHRLYDKDEHMIYIVAEESPGSLVGGLPNHEERRRGARHA